MRRYSHMAVASIQIFHTSFIEKEDSKPGLNDVMDISSGTHTSVEEPWPLHGDNGQ